MAEPSPEHRLVDVLAGLSLAEDLANGFPPEKTLRTTLIAVEIARELGLPEEEAADAYHAAMLRLIGCTSYAHEEALLFGDDIAMRNTFAPVDHGKPSEMIGTTVARLGKGSGPLRRARTVATMVATGPRFAVRMASANCEVGVRLATRLGMGEGVVTALDQIHERYDGKGVPKKLAGDRITLTARIVHVAHVTEVHERLGGPEAAALVARQRRGGYFDPQVADAFLRAWARLAEALAEGSVWDAVLAAEPRPRPLLSPGRLDDLAETFADFVDLKSPYLLGHSSGVAGRVEAAGRALGLSAEDVASLRRAGLLHDLGRVSVSSGVWDKPGALTVAEWERVRLHAYHTERILTRSPLLESIASLAGMHHERLDGSGYHRSAAAAQQSLAARVLAGADVLQALTEPRPHRAAFRPDDAARELEAMARSGKLDGDAVAALLGSPSGRRAARPVDLTEREVEVLRLLARGSSKKEIARALFVSRSTVNTHVTHIYEKAGVSSRAAVALFAIEHGLLAPEA